MLLQHTKNNIVCFYEATRNDLIYFPWLPTPWFYFQRSIPIDQLVGTGVGATSYGMGFGNAWHIADDIYT